MYNFDFEDINSQIEKDFFNVLDLEALEALRIKYLGRKGLLADFTARIPVLPVEQRAKFGRQVNCVKEKVSNLFDEKKKNLQLTNKGQEQKSQIDITAAGITQALGHRHLITRIIDEVCDIFTRLGFVVVEGPEIETEYNNFTALNIPLEHPSRDVFDTFYLDTRQDKNQGSRIKDRLLLRSHTSPVQIRVMKSNKPPLAVVVPGRVYRPDAVDASHSFMFHQIEGVMVDCDIAFSDLKGILEFFAKSVFGKAIKMRFRPHFFPFTEPSAEVDISCIICKGKGCSVCGKKGWLEVLGSGMIHPNVFKHVGYDAKKYTGFAFGMGVERIAMLKYGINDIRLFFENDLRFLKQF
ncbi:MAG: phenylalanine--tRNA ligase subunit alpha [Candidatus Omnitrophota bacterium]